MKRFNHLFEVVTSYENLYQAYLNARRGKRYRDEVLRFTANLEHNLFQIQNELLTKKYCIGRYREFYICEPKKRLIMALPFKDRVVQWAVYQIINPLLDRQFIEQSYACRKGKGVHKASEDLQNAIRKMERTYERPYYLKMDVSKFFYRIDHSVLLSILNKKIKDKDLMWLLGLVIHSDNMKFGVPLDDHNFDEERLKDIGIPIGNLLSQLFANLYLNELDQFVKHELHIHYYFRYMDDAIILCEDKQELRRILEEIDLFLKFELKLQLNNKTAIRPTNTGVAFVGQRIWSTHKKLSKSTAKKMKSRLKYLQKAYARGEVSLDSIKQTLMSYLGLMKHVECYNLKRKLLNEFVLTRNSKYREENSKKVT
ncbi:reverse transcriptase/maturase family protein [Heyndrickxia coagulans]|uniref:reverse transcriptase/maturase family protein n=1 Tax=Heyndrickxia coagulans TaxID=1398 RepID=UPI0014595C33|nr:reverse transcriptase/maturase family protein [Heyndrickxia coagulans]NMH83253.1 RNA-dependent DNA polymerase [Heyndrickxia coagulans]